MKILNINVINYIAIFVIPIFANVIVVTSVIMLTFSSPAYAATPNGEAVRIGDDIDLSGAPGGTPGTNNNGVDSAFLQVESIRVGGDTEKPFTIAADDVGETIAITLQARDNPDDGGPASIETISAIPSFTIASGGILPINPSSRAFFGPLMLDDNLTLTAEPIGEKSIKWTGEITQAYFNSLTDGDNPNIKLTLSDGNNLSYFQGPRAGGGGDVLNLKNLNVNLADVTVDKPASSEITVSSHTIVSSNIFNREFAKEGDTLTLTFSTSGVPASEPGVIIAGEDAAVTGSGTSYTATITVSALTTEGLVAYDIGSLTGQGGNAFDLPPVTSTITVDTTEPVVSITNLTAAKEQSKTASVSVTDTNHSLSFWYILDSAAKCVLRNKGGTSVNPQTFDVPLNSEDNNGKYICVVALDQPQNEGIAVSSVIEGIDTTEPAVPTISFTDTGTNTSDSITNNPTVTISGLEANSVWKYKVGSGAFTTGTGTTFEAMEGNHTYTVIQTDEAGNDSQEATENISLNTTIPVLTETTPITTPTNNQTPVYTFNTTATGRITFQGDCSSATTQVTAGSNTISLNTISEGVHSNCEIIVTDLAGNMSLPLSISEFTIDVTPPEAPGISFTDTGTNTSDSITNISTVTISGLEANSTWKYKVGSGAFTTGTGTTFEAMEGNHTYTIIQTDQAGNDSPEATKTFELDTTPPTLTVNATTDNTNYEEYAKVGTIVSIQIEGDDDFIDVTGSNVSVEIGGTPINDSRLSFVNTSSTVKMITFTVNANENGAITLDYSGIEDVPGNAIPDETKDLALTADTISPVISTFDLQSASDTCAVGNSCVYGTKTDKITFATQLVFDVSVAEINPNAIATIVDSTTPISQSVSAYPSTVTIVNDRISSDNVYSISVTATDDAGNTTASSIIDVTIDRTTPDFVTIDLDDVSDTGDSNTDNLTNKSDVSITLQSPEANVWVFPNAGVTALGTSNRENGIEIPTANGTATFSRTLATLNAQSTLSALSYDVAGNNSLSTLSVRHDDQVAVVEFDLVAADDSGYSDTDNITNNLNPTFDLSGIESSSTPPAGTGQADVIVYLWDDKNDDGRIFDTSSTTPQGTELFLAYSLDDATQTSLDSLNFNDGPLSEGIYKIIVYQQDHAGNEAYTPLTSVQYDPTGSNSKGSNVIILDETPPLAPSKPDLNPTDDTFGAYSSSSRNGTNFDDITFKDEQEYQAIASLRDIDASVDLTGAALVRETHHINFYAYTTGGANSPDLAGVSNDVSSPTAFLANPSETASRSISSAVPFTDSSGVSILQRKDSNDYNIASYNYQDLIGGYSGDISIVAEQIDAAGNISAASVPLSVRLDNTPPDPIEEDLNLHSAFDTGESNFDKHTSSTTPLFRTRGKSDAVDTDYYVIYRAQLNNQRETTNSFEYPSDSTSDDQISGNYINAECDGGEAGEDCRVRLATLLTNGQENYADGVSVYISSMTVPAFNTWYGFQIVSIDTAGNPSAVVNREGQSSSGNVLFSVGGVDQNNIQILVPPPTPETLNLATASDSTNAEYAAGSSDDITKETTITLTGRFGNGLTTTGSQATEEISSNAAGGADEVEIRITSPGGVTKKVLLDINRQDSANSEIVVPSGQNDPYTFAPEIDLEALFASDLIDGVYNVTSVTKARGEVGSASIPFEFTLDRVAPVPQSAEITLKTGRVYESHPEFGRSISFFLTGDETGTAYVALFAAEDSNAEIFNIKTELENNTRISLNSDNYNENFDYFVEYVDAAGNVSDRISLPDSARAPKISSYTISGNDRVAYEEYFGGNTASIFELSGGNVTGTTLCIFLSAYATYTRGDTITSTESSDKCLKLVDSAGNISYLRAARESVPLVANFQLGNVLNGMVDYSDDTGVLNTDRITNDTTPRLTATTIPGLAGAIEYKKSDVTVWRKQDGSIAEGVVSIVIDDLFESSTSSRFNIPAQPTLEDGTYNVRGLIILPDGTSEVAIELSDFIIDTTPLTDDVISTFSTLTGKSALENITNQTSVQFQFALDVSEIENVGEFRVIIGGDKYGDGTYTVSSAPNIVSNSIDISGAEEGRRHILEFEISDVAGNILVHSPKYTDKPNPGSVTFDRTPPVITILNTQNDDYITVASDKVGFPAQSGSSHSDAIKSNCNATDYSSNPNNVAYTLGNPVTGGGKCFSVSDKAGNTSYKHTDDAIQGVGGLNYEIDGTTVSGSILNSRNFTINGITSNDANYKLYIRERSDTPTPWNSAIQIEGVSASDGSVIEQAVVPSDGVYEIATQVQVGENFLPDIGSLAVIATITIDTLSPTFDLELSDPDVGNTVNGITYFANRNVDNYKVINITSGGTDGTPIATVRLVDSSDSSEYNATSGGTPAGSEYSFSSSERLVGEGRKTISYSVTDQAGNVTTKTKSIVADETAPTTSETGEVEVKNGRSAKFTIPFNHNQSISEKINLVFTFVGTQTSNNNCDQLSSNGITESGTTETLQEFIIKGASKNYTECAVTFEDNAGNSTATALNLSDFRIKKGGGGGGKVSRALTVQAPIVGVDITKPENLLPVKPAENQQEFTEARETYVKGQSSLEILKAQIALNKTSCFISNIGAGSKGQETRYLGTRTERAIICYQTANNLPVTGNLDPATQRHLFTKAPAQVSNDEQRKALIEILKTKIVEITAKIQKILNERKETETETEKERTQSPTKAQVEARKRGETELPGTKEPSPIRPTSSERVFRQPEALPTTFVRPDVSPTSGVNELSAPSFF